MINLADLPSAGQRILDVFAEQLTGQGIDVPDRQYVSPTQQSVWDGEQLTVALAGITQGQPGAGVGTTMVATSLNQYAQFSIMLVRVVSTVDTDKPFASVAIPSAEEIGADGARILSDATGLWKAAAIIKSQYLLVDPGEGFVIGPLQPLNVEGGLAANRLLIDLSAG